MEHNLSSIYWDLFWIFVVFACVLIAVRIQQRKSIDEAIVSPIVRAAARFWSDSLRDYVSSQKADTFGEILRSRIAHSYSKHQGDYPSIGMGALLSSSLRLGAEDLVFASAVEAGIVARTPAGRERLMQMVPNGRMQISYHSVVFAGENGEIKRLWSAPGF